MRLAVASLILAMTPGFAQDWMAQGIEAYRQARYQEAIEAFKKATDLNPSDVNAQRYLATTYMTLYVPGSAAPENIVNAQRAREGFERVLQLKANDLGALASLASLSYQEAQGISNPDEKLRKLDEVRDWNQKVFAVDPRNKEAYYTLGVIDWMKFYPNLMSARKQLVMKPEDPGPLTDPVLRQSLNARYGAIIQDGIANLEKALEIDPQYDDAMAYLNLLIRERGDLRDTTEDCRRDVEAADQWIQKALETKRTKASSQPPQRIRVQSNEQNLISKVDPAYPPLAKQARIQGTVRFSAIIGKDGRLENLQLVSGHPLLVGSAQEAVKQWVYKPTLLNGEPVEVVTQIDVNFTFPW
jgi:TonB family protein